jgi:2,4'-dihydroxyacetophenone dioxygenase
MDDADISKTIAAAMPMVPLAARDALHIGIDELPFAEGSGGESYQLLHVDLSQGLWIVRTRFQPGCQLTRHYHTGPVFAVTHSGSWYYTEYPHYVNRRGSYLFEPAGSIHTLTVPPDQEVTEVWFAIFGANVSLNPDDTVLNILDAATVLKGYRAACAAMGKPTDKLIVFGE